MKKILIFSLAYYPRVGGAEIAIKEITDRVSEVEFHMVTLRFSRQDAREEKIGRVVVHRVSGGASYLSKILFIPRAAWAAKRLHKKHRFDGAWAMMTYMVLPIVILRLCGVHIPYALTLQDGDPFGQVFNRPQIVPFKPLLKFGFTHATVVQAISHYLSGWVKKIGYTGPIEVIPNGVNVRHFAKTMHPEDRQSVWRSKEMGINDVLLITTSRLVHKNALDIVIRALPLLPKEVSFMVAGIGPEFSKLEALTKELGVSSRVHFLGEIPHAGLPRFLCASDIFIRPSRTEGLGTSFLEAMASGLPVIATQVGGIADFLFDPARAGQAQNEYGQTGWAVDVDSPEQIAEAVKNILANPEQTKKVTANALALVKEKYDWDLVAQQMQEKVFSMLIA